MAISEYEIRLAVEIDGSIAANELEKSINFLNNLNITDYNKRVLRLYIK